MYQIPKGTSDILPDQQNIWNFVKNQAQRSSQIFGFGQIETPMFEETKLFERGVGPNTDIVQKEMYSFTDSSEKSFTLKPEGTAATCRAYIQNGMHNLPKPIRLFYISPMFRHEKPQSGRLRQHHQFGAEILGDESPEIDAELIELGLHYLNSLGLEKLKIKINSIGNKETQIKYSDDLRLFFEPYQSHMSNIDKQRLATNPMRLLDSKDRKLISINNNCPKSIDYLDKESKLHWDCLLDYLYKLTKNYNKFDIEIDHKLVRGLDYYNRTVFEIHPSKQKSQSSILSGGRYDGLINLLGGPNVPGVGFGSGIERIIINVQQQKIKIPQKEQGLELMLIHLGETATKLSLDISSFLRKNNIPVMVAPKGRSVKGQMRYANSCNAKFVLVIGEKEIKQKFAYLKSLNESLELSVGLTPESIFEILKNK